MPSGDAAAVPDRDPGAADPAGAAMPDPAGAAMPADLGMLSRLADSSDRGVRAQVHAAHAELLTSEQSPLKAWLMEDFLRHCRGLVLQQDAELWLRFDLHYESFPRCWFKLRLPGITIDDFLDATCALDHCCVDRGFTKRALERPRSAFKADDSFLSCLASIDQDDSTVTVVENERQHGRLRVGYGVELQELSRSLAKAFLGEWSLEHQERGLAGPQPCQGERLRIAVATSKKRKVAMEKCRAATQSNALSLRWTDLTRWPDVAGASMSLPENIGLRLATAL